jgi:hypothetical protein
MKLHEAFTIRKPIIEEYERVAIQLSAYHGVVIKAIAEELPIDNQARVFIHVFLRMGDRDFESIKELRRALRLKAFL